jgi:hypothetical protein
LDSSDVQLRMRFFDAHCSFSAISSRLREAPSRCASGPSFPILYDEHERPPILHEEESQTHEDCRIDDFTLIRERASAPSQRAATIVSRQIRRTGTIGGSVINGSLFTDNGTFAPVPERPPTDHEYDGAAMVVKALLPLEQREG